LWRACITNKQYILDFPLSQDFQCSALYITILLGVVLVRFAPTTFHIVDVDDFTSMFWNRLFWK
jgi:hypothetical protein